MDEQIEQIARALCKVCGLDPDAIRDGVPEWVYHQTEARAAHSVMAGTIAEHRAAAEMLFKRLEHLRELPARLLPF